MIHEGDIVTVRTSVTGRTTKVKVLYVNYKHGWFTGLVQAIRGTYPEAFWIDDTKNVKKTVSKRRRLGSLIDDDPDDWLSEWDQKADAYAKRIEK